MLNKGDRFIVIKYTNGIYDCINEHIRVLEQYGYCWFGKIGMSPSEANLRSILLSDRMFVVLFCQGDVHLCELLDVSTDRPKEGYPDYYQSFFYNRGIIPSMFFKLGSIVPLSKDLFSCCISLNSRKPLLDTVSRSMASFFYGEYPLDGTHIVPYEAPPKKKSSSPKVLKAGKINEQFEPRSCIYKIQGQCTNNRCISYGFECERPQDCIKQKPKKILPK